MTPLIGFSLAVLGGILLAEAVSFSPIWFLLALPAALVLLLGWRDERWARVAVTILLGGLLGAGRMALAQPHFTHEHIAAYRDVLAEPIALEGVIVGEPDPRARYTNLRLKVERVTLPQSLPVDVKGRVLVKAPPYTTVHYGDRVRAIGVLVTPPTYKDFSYADYLARQGIHALLRDADVTVLDSHQGNPLLAALYRFKAHALDRLLTMLPEPQASLLAGILLGVETGIPDDLVEAFTATGTSHIVAISGFNLTIIAGVFASLARRLPGEKAELPLALGGLWLYTILVGASAAVLRAALMATVALIARRTDRKAHGPTSLAAAALVMALLNPYVLWDVGFQLSIAATAGLLVYVEPLTQAFTRLLHRLMDAQLAERVVGWLSDALIVTLAAQITTTGILVAVFYRLSLVTLLINFLILPVQAFVMFFGGVALLVGLVVYPVGQLLMWLAWVFLTYTIEVVQWGARLPLASIPLGQGTAAVVWAYYLALIAGTWWLGQTQETRQRVLRRARKLAQWQVAAGAATVVVFFAYLYTVPDGRLHVWVLNVGQGDAIFVQTPEGKQVLIDGGGNAARTLSELGRCMPFWDRSLDLVVLTSPDDDRLAGLIPVLERYRVEYVAVGREEGVSDHYARWAELLAARDTESVGTLWGGVPWSLDQAVTLWTLWPDPALPEGGPLVLRLSYGTASVLLAGDATSLVEEALVARTGHDLASSVLLLPRHGAKTSTTPAFLEATAPHIVVISAGESEHHPAPAVLARVMDLPLYRTDEDGTIELVFNGARVEIRVYR